MPDEPSAGRAFGEALALHPGHALPAVEPTDEPNTEALELIVQQTQEMVHNVDNARDAVLLVRRANAVDKLVDEMLKGCRVLEAQQFALRQDAAEAHLRTQRRAGQLLGEVNLHAGGRPPHLHRGGEGVPSRSVTLRELGISPHESHRWQRIARLPDHVFEAHLRAWREQKRELTTAAVLHIAKRFARQVDSASDEADETRPSGTDALLREYWAAKGHISSVIWLDPTGLARGMDASHRKEEIASLRRWRLWIDEFERALTTP